MDISKKEASVAGRLIIGVSAFGCSSPLEARRMCNRILPTGGSKKRDDLHDISDLPRVGEALIFVYDEHIGRGVGGITIDGHLEVTEGPLFLRDPPRYGR